MHNHAHNRAEYVVPVGRYNDILVLAKCQQLALVEEGVTLDLVHSRLDHAPLQYISYLRRIQDMPVTSLGSTRSLCLYCRLTIQIVHAPACSELKLDTPRLRTSPSSTKFSIWIYV